MVRENTEGEYSGAGGRVHTGLPNEVAMEVSTFTRSGKGGVSRTERYHYTEGNGAAIPAKWRRARDKPLTPP